MRIVAVGTSFGLSTIYLAAAVRDNSLTTGGQGVVIGTENEPSKAEQARLNLADAGLAEWAEVREGDFRITLRDIREPIDLVLMDIWAPLARPALDLLVPHLRDRAMVRSEERRVGNEWVSTCRLRWSAADKTKK